MDRHDKKLWAARTEDERSFLDGGVIGLGWPETGSLSELPEDRDAFRGRIDAACPDQDAVARATAANLLWRLAREIRTGDLVVLVHGPTAHLGVVTGEYAFDASSAVCAHRRPVEWKKSLPRESFSREALRETGASPVPLFAVRRYAGEFFAALGEPYLEAPTPVRRTAAPPKAVPIRSASAVRTAPPSVPLSAPADTEAFVMGRIRRIAEAGGLADLSAALLRAMGWRTERPDGSGFTAQCGELLPPMRVDAGTDRIQICTADTGVLLRSADVRDLAGLVLLHYGTLEERYRDLIPLRADLVPAEERDGRRTEDPVRRP